MGIPLNALREVSLTTVIKLYIQMIKYIHTAYVCKQFSIKHALKIHAYIIYVDVFYQIYSLGTSVSRISQV